LIPDRLFPNHLPELEKRWVIFVRTLLKNFPLKSNDGATDNRGEVTDVDAAKNPDSPKGPTAQIDKLVSQRTSEDEERPDSKTTLAAKTLFTFLWWAGYGLVVGLEMSVRAAIAASIAFLNTISWVALVFTAAAPMMLSGLYEAMIDRHVLDIIQKNRKWNRIRGQNQIELSDLKREVHLLYAILVGNISLPPEEPAEPLVEKPSAWEDIKELVDRLGPDTTTQGDEKSNEVIHGHIDNAARIATQSRLHTMLQCQASFGATIGAPVVFYLGAFLVSVFSSLLDIGHNDTAHTIAFGEWWMTIPHVAIVSGCLLAGNNPNTLEAIMSGFPNHTGRPKRQERFKGRLLRLLEYFSPVFDSIYQPVWMWERGRNKRRWVQRVQSYRNEMEDRAKQAADKNDDQQNGIDTGNKPKIKDKATWEYVKTKLEKRLEKIGNKYVEAKDDDAQPLPHEIPDFDVEDWFYLILNVVVLLLIPFVLAFLTSYYTPLIGLACRSFTFVLYFLFQFWLGVLWFWDFNYPNRLPLFAKVRGHMLPTPFALLVGFGLLGSGFTAMGGTFLQILGVYRNCLCRVPIPYWSSRHDFHIVLSSNTADSIYYAKKYWLSTGIASIVLLIVVCYFGWWYQRHWRTRFNKVVDTVLKEPPSSADTTGSTLLKPPVPQETSLPQEVQKEGVKPKPGTTVNEDEITSANT
jgi:hypothetical protein